MCNACGNVCCGSDQFVGCGCNGCDDEECWTDDEADDEFDDFGEQYGLAAWVVCSGACCKPMAYQRTAEAAE
jgi:hypothetical protein